MKKICCLLKFISFHFISSPQSNSIQSNSLVIAPYSPITIAEILSRESRLMASSTIRREATSTSFYRIIPIILFFPSFPLYSYPNLLTFRIQFRTIIQTSASESTSNTPSQPITINSHSFVSTVEYICGSAITNSLIAWSPKLRVTASSPITRLLITIPPVALIRRTSSASSALWS